VTPIRDPLFAQAVAAIDKGDIPALDALIAGNPQLVSSRLDNGETGYFADPYLLWFVAENPIRNRKLPANIVEVAQAIVGHARRLGVESLQSQLDYTLGLVSTGCVPRECGVQKPLMKALVELGARPGGPAYSLANREIEAARYLLELGAPLSLTAAACLGMWDEANRLAPTSDQQDKADALITAAYLGDVDAISFLLSSGADPNVKSLRIHKHATPLHQAAVSGSLHSAMALVAAGASLTARDAVWDSTPLGWAKHANDRKIIDFLSSAGG
jgi:peptide-methionine (S)-S-oxide reductase